MKIVILSWRDIKHPNAGGSELYFHEMAKRWIKLGNEVVWISAGWKDCKRKDVVDGIKVFRVGKEFSVYPMAMVNYFLKARNADIILDVSNGIPFFSPFYSRKNKVLHIHHIHKDVWFKEAQARNLKESIVAPLGYFLEMKIVPLMYKNTKIITLSQSSKEGILKHISKNVIGMVAPGIEFSKLKSVKKSKNPSLLFLNRIIKYKGIDILIEAIACLKKEDFFDKLEVNVAGSGGYMEEAKALAKRLGVEKKIKFHGFVSDKDKKKLFEKSWIFVNPSMAEGWGIVNIETNYFGTPVIGSNVSGIKDSVVNGKTGLLFEYGKPKELAEKIKYLIKNKKERERMSKESRKWAMKFDWDSKAKEYLDLLKGVLK